MERPTCEACGRAPAKLDDILCIDCSRAYSLLNDIMTEYPSLAKEDLDRVRTIFEWRMKKLQTAPVHR
jgi:hypothetical protein